MTTIELSYTKEQIIAFWTTELANKQAQVNQYYENQIQIRRDLLNTKFDSKDALNSKKSTPIEEIDLIDGEIEQIKSSITIYQGNIYKENEQSKLRLQNITQYWDTQKLIEVANFSGKPKYFVLPFGANVEVDFNTIIVTYLGQSYKPSFITEEESKKLTLAKEQYLISTGGEMTLG